MVLRHHYSILILVVTFVITISTTSVTAQDDDQDQRYQDCSRQYQCGDLQVGYPFWGNDRPSYCGLPDLNLTCTDNQNITITILNLNYQVLRAETSSRILTLVRTDYQGGLCPADPLNTTVDSTPFQLAPGTQLVTLYYGCSTGISGFQAPTNLGQFSCGSGNNREYFVPNENLLGSYEAVVRALLANCGTRVMVPANETAMEGLESSPTAARLEAALDQGFGVRWTADDSSCATCQASGGRCGFNESVRSFTCFCGDQPYGLECGVSGAPGPAPPQTEGQQNKRRRRPLLKILLPIVVLTILFAVALIYLRSYVSNKQNKGQSSNNPPGTKSSRFPAQFGGSREPPTLQAFSFSDIKAATNNFSGENLLGSGGFGPVYKGVLPGGELIAVKRLSKSSTQGLLEFTNEVSLTARLQHVNLVRVVGFCTEKEEKMLIYEFMPSRSLDIYLFDPVKQLSLDWNTRVMIIEGVTQGLLYLQEYSNFTIIHRDLKASNILLDDGMNPKISDFGMAKLFRKDLGEANTNRIVGTYGYVPPEYVKNGIYSMKYDVYSFGVLLLQMISSKRSQRYYGPNEDMHLLDHAYDSWRRGEGMEFCDPSLDDSSSQCKLMTCLQMALLCVQEDPDDRPTMLEVSSFLRKGALGMATPKKPAFSVRKESIVVTNSQFQQEIYSYNDDDISQVEPR